MKIKLLLSSIAIFAISASAANPNATPATPAAPHIAESLIPNIESIIITDKKNKKYLQIF